MSLNRLCNQVKYILVTCQQVNVKDHYRMSACLIQDKISPGVVIPYPGLSILRTSYFIE